MYDLHCDTIMCLIDHPSDGDLYHNHWKVDIQRLQQGGSTLQVFALFVDSHEQDDDYARYEAMRHVFNEQITKYNKYIRHVRSVADIEQNKKEGVLSALLSIEEGGVLNGDLNKLEKAYHDGVRLITLTWNYANAIGEPHCGDPSKGLTSKGREFVERMAELGMIVDCSHLNDKGTEQLGEILPGPFIASHSNARAVTPHSRNLPDHLIRLIAEKGGVIGLNFAQTFLGTSPISRIDDMVRHTMHLYNVGGEDVLALGTDFDGIAPFTEIEDIGQMDRLYDAVIQGGLTPAQADKMFTYNGERVIKEIIR